MYTCKREELTYFIIKLTIRFNDSSWNETTAVLTLLVLRLWTRLWPEYFLSTHHINSLMLNQANPFSVLHFKEESFLNISWTNPIGRIVFKEAMQIVTQNMVWKGIVMKAHHDLLSILYGNGVISKFVL